MNYLIIGGDGKQYGPVTADQIRQWVGEGRLNAETQVALDGTADWKRLGDVAELTAGAAAVPPGLVPKLTGPQMAEKILARDYTVDIGACIGRSWALLKSDFMMLVAVTAVLIVVVGGVGFLLNLLLTPFVGPFVNQMLVAVFTGGLYGFFLKKIRGEAVSFGDVFAGFTGRCLVPLILVGLLTGILTMLGFVLCIIPGIFLAVAWCFAVPLVFDKGMDAWEAMELSRKVVTKHWFPVFLLLLVAGLIGLLGVLACGVGVFVAAPVCIGAVAYAYEDIFGAAS